MTVNEFIEILKKARDTDIAPIEFWFGDKELTLDSLGQFGILANVTVHLKEAKSPVIEEAVIQRSKRKMTDKKLKEINKSLKKNKTHP